MVCVWIAKNESLPCGYGMMFCVFFDERLFSLVCQLSIWLFWHLEVFPFVLNKWVKVNAASTESNINLALVRLKPQRNFSVWF